MRRAALYLALMVTGLLALPAAASAAPCGQVNRILDTPVNIPDIPQGSATNRIWLPYSSSSEAIEDVDINVDITHPFDADLEISVSHNGKSVNLSSDNGGGANFSGTIFDDESGTAITAGASPFAGSFKPEAALSAFDGEQSGGIWTITVRDDQGTIFNEGDPPPPPQRINSWGIRWASNVCATNSRTVPCDQQVARVDTAIPNPGSGSSSFTTTGSGSVTRVEPGATVTHPNVGDVRLGITHNATRVDLANNLGGSGDNYRATVFSDAAATSITAASPPFTGSYKPEELLSVYNGGTTSGSWSISVEDTVGGADSGTTDIVTLRVLLTTCVDPDSDAVWSAVDNCPDNANTDQANHDRFKDTIGDVCDPDDDQDGVADTGDACPLSPSDTGPPGADLDGDGCYDTEDLDQDGDGVADTGDGCPRDAVGSDADPDGDGCGSTIDPDDDGDGVTDTADSCPTGVVGTGDDADGNGCKGTEDPDGDGIVESLDRCSLGNPGAGGDSDRDGCKDTEDADDDDDGAPDTSDNCAALANAKQDDLDRDGQGDPCDVDDDGDGLVDGSDACQRLTARSLSGCPAFTRTASFKFTSRTKLSGTIKVSGRTAAPECTGKQSVVLSRVKRGKDPAVGKPLVTTAAGKFTLTRRLAKGKYYVTVKAATVRDVAECGAVKSKTVTRR